MMNTKLHPHGVAKKLLVAVLVTQLGVVQPVYAATVALATSPLANSTTTNVKPNLMFLMDNSGSMSQDFTPDYLMEYNYRFSPWTSNGWNSPSSDQKNCKDSADDDGSIVSGFSNMDLCVVGDVPLMTGSINSQYYNPEIRYLPGVNADGSSKPSQTDPTNVLRDGYGLHNYTQLGDTSSTTIDLTTQYPDRIWCTTNAPTAAQMSDTSVCRKNSDYLYPNATFKYGRDNNGTTANKDVLGVMGAPYFYKVVVSEYCKEAELRNCTNSAVPTGQYIFPAKNRWCSDTALQTCQSTRTTTYQYPRYVGASTSAVAATGSFRVGTNTPRTITSVQVNGVEILGAPMTGTSQANLASKVATQINTYTSSPEYTATTCSDGTYVCITSTLAAGATANGTIALSGSAGSSNIVNASGGVTATSAAPYTFARTDIVPATTSYPKSTSRTDCLGATCTYAEEITNFANWYAYYRTRMQAMKSSVSQAFKPIGSNYRVGFINICKNDYLPVAPFDNSDTSIGAVAGSGSFIFSTWSSGTKTVTSIKVNGIEILGGSVSATSAEGRSVLASRVATQINSYVSSPEYTAVANSGSTGKISLTSTLIDGANSNGAIVVTGATVSSVVNVAGGVTGNGQKSQWYSKLFSQTAVGCGTPLRDALSAVGRIYAGKQISSAGSTSGSTIDPVQYSCQQNFTLLTTDGYWNGNGGYDIDGNTMGNMDASPVARPMYEGPTATSNTLADVAKYYYDTDLRTSALSNCTGSLGVDVCENNVFVSSTDTNNKQHMTTFTLGLGVDGTLSYVTDYKNATSGDYYNLLNGLGSPTVNWPVPTSDSETAVDDLWHAAVNGQGTYFSAKDPAQLGFGLATALNQIGSKVGAASAAATSTLNPVAGNNYAFVASYSTVKWTGNLEARTINVSTGVVSENAAWCVENIVGGTCNSPSVIQQDPTDSNTYFCVTSGATSATCTDGVLDGTNCKVQLPKACTGTMNSKVGKTSDTRLIYKNDGSGGLEAFNYSNLSASERSYFTGTGLSQWSVLTADQKTAAAGENLVNFLRGQTGYEDRTSNTADNRLFRMREAILGDALESQPNFSGKPGFAYGDTGYSDYKTANATRAGTIFMGTNDGMLHAFAADTGQERWAYIPTAVLPNMWKLADKNYSTGHVNYVNGAPTVGDICVANCSCDANCVAAGGSAPVWKTILVGGLNAGGRSYFAFDITTPSAPTLLWEKTPADADFNNLGYSYGVPIITKKADGTWVVLLTSGYNNVSPGDGKGYLYVLNAWTGALVGTPLTTGVGDTTTPSGLAKVSAWADASTVNNTAGPVYGGDLLGNLWRFDINAGTVTKFATLKDSSNNPQPVTVAPSLGLISSKKVVFVGTGKYLEVSDLTDTHAQSIYAIRDDDSGTTLTNPRSVLVQQTLSTSGSSRTATSNPVNWNTGRGWYVDLPDSGERVNVDMTLVQGTLIAPSIVPSNTVCSPGGYGWLNYFDYETGGYVDSTHVVSSYFSSPIVGVNVIYINGKPVIEVVTATNPTPTKTGVPIRDTGRNFVGKRVIWREWIPQ